MQDDKLELIPVPLPTEIPAPPNLENIPTDILHSATVEMLIQQNEDLSSRLKVNLRRNSQLEQKLIENDKEISLLNRKRENVLAQIEIVKEKEKIWGEQKQTILKQNESLQQEAELLERRYNELFTTTKQREKEQRQRLENKNRELAKVSYKLDVLHRVRVRAKDKLRNLLIDMARGFQKQEQTHRISESSRRLLQKNFEGLRNEISDKETFFRDQLENLKKASQKALIELDLEKTKLIEQNGSLKNQIQELREEVQGLEKKLFDEKKLRVQLSTVSSELSQLKNQQIKQQRTLQSKLEQSEDARLHEVSKIKILNAELRVAQQESADSKEKISQCEQQIMALAKDNKQLADQLSAMQELWIEAQAKLEKEELKSEALHKINKQLSSRPDEKSKIERATERAQQKSEPEELKNRIQQVFASQYRTMAKGPDMDV